MILKKKRYNYSRSKWLILKHLHELNLLSTHLVYMDILKLVLKEKNKEHLLDNILDLTMWLEFGVSMEKDCHLLN